LLGLDTYGIIEVSGDTTGAHSMIRLTVRLREKLHAEATAKAKRELRSLSAVVNRLLEKWIAGEVDLEPPTKESEGELSEKG
jgi:hypothetical protein